MKWFSVLISLLFIIGCQESPEVPPASSEDIALLEGGTTVSSTVEASASQAEATATAQASTATTHKTVTETIQTGPDGFKVHVNVKVKFKPTTKTWKTEKVVTTQSCEDCPADKPVEMEADRETNPCDECQTEQVVDETQAEEPCDEEQLEPPVDEPDTADVDETTDSCGGCQVEVHSELVTEGLSNSCQCECNCQCQTELRN